MNGLLRRRYVSRGLITTSNSHRSRPIADGKVYHHGNGSQGTGRRWCFRTRCAQCQSGNIIGRTWSGCFNSIRTPRTRPFSWRALCGRHHSLWRCPRGRRPTHLTSSRLRWRPAHYQKQGRGDDGGYKKCSDVGLSRFECRSSSRRLACAQNKYLSREASIRLSSRGRAPSMRLKSYRIKTGPSLSLYALLNSA